MPVLRPTARPAPKRVSGPPEVSLMSRMPLFWTVIAPVPLENRPEPLTLRVPSVTVIARVVVCAVVKFSVPVPILLMVTPEVPMLPLTLMTPVPTALKVGLLPRPRPPILSVAPLAAPKVMPAEPVFVIAPAVPMEFTPLAENTPPVLLIPEAPKAPTAMSMGFKTVTPLVR